MNNPGIEKLTLIKGSFRCFGFGLLGLLPLIGVPFGLVALWMAGNLRKQENQWWNAAKPYRIMGAICGGVGVVMSAGIVMLVAGAAVWSYLVG